MRTTLFQAGLIHSLRHALAGTVLAVAFAAPALATPLIDDFLDDQYVEIRPHPTAPGGQALTALSIVPATGGNTVLGGEREIFLETVNPFTGSRFAKGSVQVSEGVLSLNNDTGVRTRAHVIYDGSGEANPGGLATPSVLTSGLGAVDLTQGGTADAFLFNVLSSDQDFNLIIRIWSNGGTEVSEVLWATPEVNTLISLAIPFGYFTGEVPYAPPENAQTNADLDFTQISAMQIVMWGFERVDFAIGELESTSTIPAPGALGLIGLGLVGSGLLRRR